MELLSYTQKFGVVQFKFYFFQIIVGKGFGVFQTFCRYSFASLWHFSVTDIFSCPFKSINFLPFPHDFSVLFLVVWSQRELLHDWWNPAGYYNHSENKLCLHLYLINLNARVHWHVTIAKTQSDQLLGENGLKMCSEISGFISIHDIRYESYLDQIQTLPSYKFKGKFQSLGVCM